MTNEPLTLWNVCVVHWLNHWITLHEFYYYECCLLFIVCWIMSYWRRYEILMSVGGRELCSIKLHTLHCWIITSSMDHLFCSCVCVCEMSLLRRTPLTHFWSLSACQPCFCARPCLCIHCPCSPSLFPTVVLFFSHSRPAQSFTLTKEPSMAWMVVNSLQVEYVYHRR